MKIAIIGGGLTGLALARHFSGRGHAVTLFEKEKQLGGLATYHDYGAFYWDRFYHVILPSDIHLLGFLRDIGLGNSLRWNKTLTGFYVDHQFYSISNSWEFLTFPPLDLWSKLRLALTILYCARIDNWRALERVSVEDWLVKTGGNRTFERFWKPLLLAKLGEHYKRVSAVFIWSYIKRLYSARDAAAQKETLGYVAGGYKTVVNRLEALIYAAGGGIRSGVSVSRLAPAPGGGISVDWHGLSETFDKVIYTGPVNILQQIVADELIDIDNQGRQVEYLGVICMVLVTRKPLVPYYVLNIADPRVPFTGIIGMSNLVATEETAGRHLTYFPKYVHSQDPLLRQSDAELSDQFLAGLRLMFPDFQPYDLESIHINRAFKVQPLQVLNYSQLVPTVNTRNNDFFVLNTSQFVNGTLNNDGVIRAVNEFLAAEGARFW